MLSPVCPSWSGWDSITKGFIFFSHLCVCVCFSEGVLQQKTARLSLFSPTVGVLRIEPRPSDLAVSAFTGKPSRQVASSSQSSWVIPVYTQARGHRTRGPQGHLWRANLVAEPSSGRLHSSSATLGPCGLGPSHRWRCSHSEVNGIAFTEVV